RKFAGDAVLVTRVIGVHRIGHGGFVLGHYALNGTQQCECYQNKKNSFHLGSSREKKGLDLTTEPLCMGCWRYFFFDGAIAIGFDAAYGLPPRAFEMSVMTFCALTLLPASSSGGETTAMPNLPGETAMIPPPTPLLAGRPVR